MKLSVFFLYLIRVAEQENISIKQALLTAKKLGYDALDIDKEELKKYPEVIEESKKAGLKIVNVYGEYDLLGGKDDNAFELIDFAVKCGAKVAMLLPGTFTKEEFPENCKLDAAAMRKFLEQNFSFAKDFAISKRFTSYSLY